jgi:6-phospho-3-hexuloisomerase
MDFVWAMFSAIDPVNRLLEKVGNRMTARYHALAQAVTNEVAQVLSRVEPDEVDRLAGHLTRAQKVFVFAVGRVFLSLQCLAKRLAHLGLDVQVVGSITEKPITQNDLLLIASGSGESKLPAEIARIAGKHAARIALITSADSSTIKSLADAVVHLPCPTKADARRGVQSIQFMSTLFDQSLHLFGDVLCLMLQEKMGLTDEVLWKRHANLE